MKNNGRGLYLSFDLLEMPPNFVARGGNTIQLSALEKDLMLRLYTEFSLAIREHVPRNDLFIPLHLDRKARTDYHWLHTDFAIDVDMEKEGKTIPLGEFYCISTPFLGGKDLDPAIGRKFDPETIREMAFFYFSPSEATFPLKKKYINPSFFNSRYTIGCKFSYDSLPEENTQMPEEINQNGPESIFSLIRPPTKLKDTPENREARITTLIERLRGSVIV